MMAVRFEIVTRPDLMTIFVKDSAFPRPRLYPLPERDTSLKAEICGPTIEYKAREVYKYYASMLGVKFNHRFRAANYWLWIGNVMSDRVANLLRSEGRRWNLWDDRLVYRAHQALPYVKEAERDGLINLIPVIVTFGASPHDIRKTIGQGAWRRIAHNSITRNRLLMLAMQRVRGHGDEAADTEMFGRLLEIPSGLLRYVHGAQPDEVIAARITPKITLADFMRTQHIIRDTRDMMGFAFNSRWSFARMEREHADATKAVARKQFSDHRFADDWTFAADGYTAKLLTSQLDIAVEGNVQHHCVAAYAKLASRLQYAVLRIDGKERATLGLRRVGSIFRVDQLYGACNSFVSPACEAFCTSVVDEYDEYALTPRAA
jgi:hypothetical protein